MARPGSSNVLFGLMGRVDARGAALCSTGGWVGTRCAGLRLWGLGGGDAGARKGRDC